MKLAQDAEALAYDTAFWLLGFEPDDGLPIEQQGKASMELGAKLRALAIITLLTKGDSEKFLHNLVRSGRVRERYLMRIKQAGRDQDHHFASARIGGFLDALAAGDVALARNIAWLSPRQWQPQREYEDDFCYAQVLHRLVHGVDAASVYEPWLTRFETALEGAPSARLDVLRALVARSAADFDPAFAALVDARRQQIAEDIARCQLETPQIVAERLVFVEGLALLRLADVFKLPTQADYLYCPANARRQMRTPVPTEPPPGAPIGEDDE